MKASTKNRLAGTYRELKGNVKVAVGNTVSSPRIALEGHVDKAAGIVQAKFGSFEKILGW